MHARAFAFRERSIVWSLGLSVALFAARDAQAAEPRPQGSGFVVAAGIGVGAMDVSDQSGSQTGFAGGGTLGLAGRRFELDFEIAAQPFRVDNPVALESSRVVYLLPSLRVHGQHAYLRVGVGWARYSWSGPEAFVSSDSGPAVFAAVGYELARPRAIPVAIEAYFRSGTSDYEFSSRLAGVQLGEVRILRENAIVSLVGRGFFRYQGLSRRIFEALSDVNVVMISFAASDVNISVLVAEADAERAVHSLHREFFYKSAEGPSAEEKSSQKSSGGRKSPRSGSLPR